MMIIIALLLNTITSDKITGRWETKKSPKGNITGIVFKEDKSFECYVNRKPFTSGTYEMNADTLSFVDTGCKGETAKYRIIFFNNEDSMKFEFLADPCTERKEGMSRMVLGRIKKNLL